MDATTRAMERRRRWMNMNTRIGAEIVKYEFISKGTTEKY